jgi:hypothetical protein
MIKLGWKAGAEQYPPRELLDYAVAADQAGFDLLDVSDHFHGVRLARRRPYADWAAPQLNPRLVRRASSDECGAERRNSKP